jgi:hypothetical protein
MHNSKRLRMVASESSTEDLEHGKVEFDRDLEITKHKISTYLARHGGRDLNVLTRDGLTEGQILTLLALVVLDEAKKWPDSVRRKQKELQSVVERTRNVCKDLRLVADDPSAKVQFWFYTKSGGAMLGMKVPEPLSADPSFEHIMRSFDVVVKRLDDQAKRLGRFLQTYGDRRTNLSLPMTFVLVCLSLRIPAPQHLNEWARILTDAYDACGKQKRFSANWLEKVWRRRGRPLLRLAEQNFGS